MVKLAGDLQLLEDLISTKMEQEPENTVNYELYSSKRPSRQTIADYKDKVKSILPQEFSLEEHDEWNLCHGSVDFSEDIEVEWLIVYVLFELSKQDTDLVIRVFDRYGDILLIEAAEHLPRWLESSKSKDRVFIHKGKLHIIPEHINLKDLHNKSKNSATVTQLAAQFIRDMNSTNGSQDSLWNGLKVKTLADSKIQDAIKEQLSGLPDTKVWMEKKLKQLDEIISENTNHLQKQFNESLSLASVMAMDDADLRISPISSLSASSSSSWLTEPGEVEDDDKEEDGCDRK